MKKSPSAKFFCESCGSEVPGNAKFCRKCGRFFASVRCPSCGATGSNEKFKNGCPVCGYSAARSPMKNIKEKNGASRAARRRLVSAIDARNGAQDGSLPRWTYPVMLLVLALSIAFSVYYMGR